MLQLLDDELLNKIMFSDEATFHVMGKINKMCIWICLVHLTTVRGIAA
jgi:hypothetical protein